MVNKSKIKWCFSYLLGLFPCWWNHPPKGINKNVTGADLLGVLDLLNWLPYSFCPIWPALLHDSIVCRKLSILERIDRENNTHRCKIRDIIEAVAWNQRRWFWRTLEGRWLNRKNQNSNIKISRFNWFHCSWSHLRTQQPAIATTCWPQVLPFPMQGQPIITSVLWPNILLFIYIAFFSCSLHTRLNVNATMCLLP